ncbi:MAG: L-glutamate gamma-semialdehyde dehydrogenase [Planctomycetes bacterium]|nr:L-glutamate gamma-semialdehyde dehydrogenase [Planctomycetota bacterium]
MTHGIFRTPTPVNEPVKSYAPRSAERASLEATLRSLSSSEIEIPLVIGGREVRTGEIETATMPHDHRHVVARIHRAKPEHVAAAIEAASAAKHAWERTPWEERAAIFLRVGELLAGPWRDRVNAATMLGQSKTVHQAEIDSACETIDFMRFNVHFMERLYAEQPQSSPGVWNRLEHRPLDGYVFAVSPFNFTSIAANLASAPAMLGNTVVWKPASTSIYSNYMLMKLYEAAGLPAGVINFVPGQGSAIGDAGIADRRLAGVHFTGSTGVFNGIWGTVGKNIAKYAQYPRLVGETGGKDFVFVHASAEVDVAAVALVRGSFEYQGQKCSAASRAYVPKSLWPALKERMAAMLAEIKTGDVADMRNFMGAVIDKRSFDKLKAAIDAARTSSAARIVFGGGCDCTRGWFIEPTVIEALDPKYDTMCTELFGPILTIHVYDDARYAETLELCNTTSEYALTGAILANDRTAVRQATDALRFAAGNFYVNDKPTGAVVGQQPFGGARASGTNDKAGSILNLLRWVSPRTIKETFVPPTDWRYPFLGQA